METRYHFLSIDSYDDLTATPLMVAITPGGPEVTADHSTTPEYPGTLPAVPTGATRYWWRILVGPGQTLDPTDVGEPVTAYGRLVDAVEVLEYQWVIGDPAPDRLPEFADHRCWPVVIPEAGRATWEARSAEVQEYARAAAVNALTALTAGVVGGCPVIIRPCMGDPPDPTWRTYPVHGQVGWQPLYLGGVWRNVGCGTCGGVCGCGQGVSIRLPGPVGRVDAVWVDGVELTAGVDYRVSGSVLWRLRGEPWPRSQNHDAAFDADGAFAVIYLNAWPVDALAALAAGALAVEYADDLATGKCRLPKTATQVSRAGVTVQLDKRRGSATVGFPDGITGLVAVDAWVRSVNPHGLRSRPRVWSPDMGTLAAPRV